MKLRTTLLVLVTVVVLGYFNWSVLGKERLITEGRPVLLALAPFDPRSLIQGDYMQLAYAITRDVYIDNLPRDGFLVLQLDQDNVAQFRRVHDNRQLAADEVLLRYRKRGFDLRLGAEEFFFQEGHAQYYETARYAELRIAPDGTSVLVGLRDEQREPLGPPEDSPLRPSSG